MKPPTIFISIASYCDPMLGFTLASARSQAADPSRVFIGVVEQQAPWDFLRPEDEWSRDHVRWIRIDALEARGPCWARALAMTLYQREDWYLQVDSHTWFEPGWDDRLVHWGRRCGEFNPRSILSCYPNPFVMRDGHPVAQPVTSRVLAFVVAGEAEFAAEHPVLPFECVAVERDEPVSAIHVAGGGLFAPGCIVDELPYDPWLYFHGEEQAFAVRAYTRGWDLFQIPGMPLYHLYTQPGAASRQMHWSPVLDEHRAARWETLEAASRRRLAALLWDGCNLGVYGLGTVRTLADFAAESGIDYSRRIIEPRARKARFGHP